MTHAHILIVEDEASIYRRTAKKLREANFSVDEYTPSVQEAEELILKNRPDFVLLDIKLKGEETGIALGEKLKNTYNIPFIYVTEYDDHKTFYQGLEKKPEQYMFKNVLNYFT